MKCELHTGPKVCECREIAHVRASPLDPVLRVKIHRGDSTVVGGVGYLFRIIAAACSFGGIALCEQPASVLLDSLDVAAQHVEFETKL